MLKYAVPLSLTVLVALAVVGGLFFLLRTAGPHKFFSARRPVMPSQRRGRTSPEADAPPQSTRGVLSLQDWPLYLALLTPDVWLLAPTTQPYCVRLVLVDNNTFHIERVSGELYADRTSNGMLEAEVFVFRKGQPEVQQYALKLPVVVGRVVTTAHTVLSTEKNPSLPASADEVRRVLRAMQRATPFPEVD